MDLVLKFLEENFGLAFTLGVLIVGTVLSGVVWLTAWVVKVLSKNKELENKITGLPCQDHKNILNQHSEKIDILNKMSGQVEFIVKWLTSTYPNSNPPEGATAFTKKASPRKLNTNGEKLYKDIKGDMFFQENEAFLLAELEKLNPKTALDVEKLSFAILRTNSDRDSFVSLKNWVYNAPVQEIVTEDGQIKKKEVTLEDVLYVLSIPLRDKYLLVHPEINKEE